MYVADTVLSGAAVPVEEKVTPFIESKPCIVDERYVTMTVSQEFCTNIAVLPTATVPYMLKYNSAVVADLIIYILFVDGPLPRSTILS